MENIKEGENSDSRLISNLQWLSDEQSKSYFDYVDKERFFVRFNIFFKDKGSYLTAEGWILGTECWVCSLDTYNKVRVMVCRPSLSDCIEEAVNRIKKISFW